MFRFTISYTIVALGFILFSAVGALSADIELIRGGPADRSFIVVSGEILPGDDEKFHDAAGNLETATVILESPGGNVEAGLSIAAETRMRKFSTLVTGNGGCFSICAVVWVSGTGRAMTTDAKIGVHAAYSPQAIDGLGPLMLESGMANADIGAFLNSIGLSRKAIRYFTAAGPGEINPVTPEIAQVLDIDVALITANAVITPAQRPTPRRIAHQAARISAFGNLCAGLFDLDPGSLHKRAIQVLENGHDLFGGEIFVESLPLISDAEKRRLSEIGTMSYCLETEYTLRDEGFTTEVAGPSFDCRKAVSLTEYTICSSRDLWALDRATAHLYFLLRASYDRQNRAILLKSQRAWIVERDNCGRDISCLYTRYLDRIADFGF
ncbi:ATP-dependent Clp protease proteolytic subunit [Rhodovulum euryhalinum]|uniref:ClpP protease-like protein n=1 Tax=Rhodovulum euryhalinum TaxID=35805 RepID=A0A4R2KNC3_9RHOB|nr:ATP-dependent Clp protease proteolytic subunit [Rhodovulum euryhalinum]TCO74067.1 ClpP protease-like protein [Rhodovulum euryhalinum]